MYEWVKAVHIIAVIAWMAGMLYLPRLMVYHAEAQLGSIQSETFKIMERRLLKAIINPAMITAWLAGLWLIWAGGWYSAGWLHAKLVLVLLMITHYSIGGRWLKGVDAGKPLPSATALRWFNEAPVFLLVAIVFLVLAKPF